jgi:hypothetical protein
VYLTLSTPTGSVVDRLCSDCAEYADDQGNPLQRMSWMTEEPAWWQNASITMELRAEQEEAMMERDILMKEARAQQV